MIAVSMQMSSRIALRKLKSDLTDLQTGDYDNLFKLNPEESNMFLWKGEINGPEGTPYEGGIFEIDIAIPQTYPNVPPLIRFVSKIFHPNIDRNGQICLNILRSPPNGDWKPSINLPKAVLSVHSLLSDPNPLDPLDAEAGLMYTENHSKFVDTARAWTAENISSREL
jgi:ubiquitin-protein ligase